MLPRRLERRSPSGCRQNQRTNDNTTRYTTENSTEVFSNRRLIIGVPRRNTEQADRRSRLEEWRALRKTESSQQHVQLRRMTMVTSNSRGFGSPPLLPRRGKSKKQTRSSTDHRGNGPVPPSDVTTVSVFTAKPRPIAARNTTMISGPRQSVLSRSVAPVVAHKPTSGSRPLPLGGVSSQQHSQSRRMTMGISKNTGFGSPPPLPRKKKLSIAPTQSSTDHHGNGPVPPTDVTTVSAFTAKPLPIATRKSINRPRRSVLRRSVAPVVAHKPTSESRPLPVTTTDVTVNPRGRRSVAMFTAIPQPVNNFPPVGGVTQPLKPRRSLAPRIPNKPTLSSALKSRQSLAPSVVAKRRSVAVIPPVLSVTNKRVDVIEEEIENIDDDNNSPILPAQRRTHGPSTPAMIDKLKNWLVVKGKTPSKFQRMLNSTHQSTPPRKRKISDLDEFYKTMLKQSWMKALEKEDKEKKDQVISGITSILDECSRLLNMGYDAGDINSWLTHIRTTYPDCVSITQYWLCLATCAAAIDNISAALAVFKEAQSYNPQPRVLFWDTYRTWIAQPILPKVAEEEGSDDVIDDAAKGLSNHDCPDVFQTPSAKRSCVRPTDRDTSPGVAGTSEEGEKTPMFTTPLQTPSRLNIKKQLHSPVLHKPPSSIIKYKITPYRSVQFCEDVNTVRSFPLTTTVVVTPVRRSTRLSLIQHKLPSGLHERDDLVSSLDLISGKENMTFIQQISELFD